MKTIALLLSMALLLAFMPWHRAGAQDVGSAVGNAINMIPTQIAPLIAGLVQICTSAGINSILTSIYDIFKQVLFIIQSCCRQNPEFVQGIVNSIVLCTALWAILGCMFPVPVVTSLCCTPAGALFGAAIGPFYGCIDGWLRWVGYYMPAPSDIEAAKRQAEIDNTTKPQYVVVPVQ